MKKLSRFSLVILLLAYSKLSAAQIPGNNTGKATIVKSQAINAAAISGKGLVVADSVLKVVSIEDKYQVGVSVVSRSKINDKTPADAIIHDVVTEVYHIVEGSGILLVGGTLDSPVQIPAGSAIVKKITGPSSTGKKINGGTQYEVGPGDVVVIPPNTPHGFIELITNTIVYTLIRIDSEKVLELKN